MAPSHDSRPDADAPGRLPARTGTAAGDTMLRRFLCGDVMTGRGVRMIRPVWLVATLGWALLLGFPVLWLGEEAQFWALVAELRFNGLSWTFAKGLLAAIGLAALPFAVLGVLARLAFGAARGAAVLVAAPVALLLAGVLTWIVAGLQSPGGWQPPAVVELLLPWCAALVGVIAGAAFLGGAARFLPSLLWRLTLVVLLAGAALVATATRVLGTELPDLPRAVVTSEQKRTLVTRLRHHNPLRLAEGKSGGLALTPEELQALLGWVVLLVDDDGRASVTGRDDAVEWGASVRLPVGLGERRQLTVRGEFGLASGPAGIIVERCALALGTLRVAPWLCRSAARSLYRLSRASGDLGALAAAVESLRVDAAGLSASYVRPDLDDGARRRLQLALGPGPEVRAAAAAQFDLLRSEGMRLARSNDRFAAVMRAAFELAQRRSAYASPVAENQGAILALATILGHHDVATLAGIDRPLDWRALRATVWPVRLRGREDWTRHFLVSAALTQISTAAVSDAAGLLKEELDAARRSGFSFGDLLADRAGTRFGEVAAHDDATARALQTALVRRYRVADLMPRGDDLPEGLSDEELERRYGGVGGAGYRALVAEIEARVARLPNF